MDAEDHDANAQSVDPKDKVPEKGVLGRRVYGESPHVTSEGARHGLRGRPN